MGKTVIDVFQATPVWAGLFVWMQGDDRDESRQLRIGDHVSWGTTVADLGKVVGTAWTGVAIDWDDGHKTSIEHNDTARVERVSNNRARRCHEKYECAP